MYPRTSKVALWASVMSLVYYAAVILYFVYQWRTKPVNQWIYHNFVGYDHFFMMASVNMLLQVVSSILHIFGHFSSPALRIRDYIYANYSFPYSTSTVITFWTFWALVGRHRPVGADTINYPWWVTHGFHSLSSLVNMLLLFTMRHQYNKHPLVFSRGYPIVCVIAALLMYTFAGSFKAAQIGDFTFAQAGYYYSTFALLAHMCHAFGYVFSDVLSLEDDYNEHVAAKIAEAEVEISSAPTPISRTPTPLIIAPRSSPPLGMPLYGDDDDDVIEVTIPTVYRSKAKPRASSSRHSKKKR